MRAPTTCSTGMYNQDFARAEQLSIPLTLIVLLLAFGALVAAGIPVLLAFSAVLAAVGLNALSATSRRSPTRRSR